MSQHGATLQTYNQELVKCLEDLKMKRNEMLIIVKREEQEKQSIEKNMDLMRDKLNVVTESLEKHRSLCESYEKTIQDTEAGFKKILETSQILLNLAQTEASKLSVVVNKNEISPKLDEATNPYCD